MAVSYFFSSFGFFLSISRERPYARDVAGQGRGGAVKIAQAIKDLKGD